MSSNVIVTGAIIALCGGIEGSLFKKEPEKKVEAE